MFLLLDTTFSFITTHLTDVKSVSFFESELFAVIVGSCFTLFGVIVGNISARKTAKSLEKTRLLSEVYSEVFTAFSSAYPFPDDQNTLAFLVTAEKAKLLCSKDSEEILNQLICIAAASAPSPDECVRLIVELRQSAKKDLRKR